ncbi:hypothetical protein ACP275_11G065400 [Erythranthe tilingii]
MDPNRFTSTGPDSIPSGLRVLGIDGDPACLENLEHMLRKCNYQVATCNSMQEALNLLQKRKDGFDIVISDVSISDDVDGLKFLEHVRLKMDLPVIMMSADGETSTAKKAIENGACDYFVKPLKTKVLRYIWQHVYRKRLREMRDIEGQQQSVDQIQSDDILSGDKRKDLVNNNNNNNNNSQERDPQSSTKKARVVWSVDLHQKFIKAVNLIGIDKVGPKRILDLMEVPWLTRENVASHLQKYRLYLSRLQKENELKTASSGPGSKNKGDAMNHPPPISSNTTISPINYNRAFGSEVKPKPELQLQQQAWNTQSAPTFQLNQPPPPNPYFHNRFENHLPLATMTRKITQVGYFPNNPMYDSLLSSHGIREEGYNGYASSSSSHGGFCNTPSPDFVNSESFGFIGPDDLIGESSSSQFSYPQYLSKYQGQLNEGAYAPSFSTA